MLVLLAVPAGVSVSWDTSGIEGTREIVVTVDEADVVDEQVEGNNAASRDVRVRPA